MKYVVILLLVAQAYVSWRTFKILPFPSWGKWVAVCVMLLALLALVVRFTRQFQGVSNLWVDTILYDVGTSWLVALLYLTLAFAFLDLLTLLHIVPQDANTRSCVASLIVFGGVFALLTFGYFNYNSKKRVELKLTTPKSIPRPLKLVMISDVHLGYHIGKAEFSQWVDKINAENPDMIIIAGDIVDISVSPINEQHLEEEFHKFKAPVYACYGNHEYFSGIDEANQFYKKAGIHLLKDDAAEVKGINIVGRDDRMNGRRATLHSLMQSVDTSKFTILIDHQPYHLEQAEREKVDFQFSGHTHQGQVFPISLITGAIYEKDHGYLRRGATQYYVSSGIGIWGGKFRIGTCSEYLVVNLLPTNKLAK